MDKKERYNVFLFSLLAFAIIVGMVGSFLMVRLSRSQSEEYFELILTNRAETINEQFREISTSVDMLTTAMSVGLDSAEILANPQYEEAYTARYLDICSELLKSDKYMYSQYLRYNPRIVGGRTGFFVVKENNQIVEIPTTDISKYDEKDLQHVGWYYLPIAFGSAIWTEPYYSESTNTYMMSYSSPIVCPDTVAGVVGADINLTPFLASVDEIKVCKSGYALLYDKSGKVLNNIPDELGKNMITKSVQLENGMTLEICAPENEVYKLRKSVVFQIMMCVYILMMIILIGIQVRKILKHDEVRENVSAILDKREKMVNTLHLLALIAIVLVQLGYLGFKFYDKYSYVNKRYEAENEYSETLKVAAFDNFIPYSFLDGNERMSGAYIEIINELANRLNMNVDITLMPQNKIHNALVSGDVDVILGADVNDEAQKDEHVYSNEVMTEAICVYGFDSLNSTNDLYDKNVGMVKDFLVSDVFGFSEGGNKYKSYKDAINAVKNEKNEYIILRRNALTYLVGMRGYEAVPEVYEINTVSLKILTANENTELLNKINTAILSMEEDGTLSEIRERWYQGDLSKTTVFTIVKEEAGFFEFTAILFVIMIFALAFSSIMSKKNKEIRKEKNHSKELQRISDIDELTGLYNRRHYEMHVKELKEATSLKDVTIVAMDVNGLKETNDNLGHAAGDELLKLAGDVIKETFGSFGECFRIGGDEFTVIASGEIPNYGELTYLFKQNIERAESENIKKLSISFGIVNGGDYFNVTIDELISAADQLMYADKVAYYQQRGIDRRGQQAAYGAICESYAKILKVNLTTDSYNIIQADVKELNQEKGFDDRISVWMHNFATSGQIAKEDAAHYLEKTDINYLREFFKNKNQEFCIQYGRRTDDEFIEAMMEIIPAPEYTDENQIVYMFVKNIATHEGAIHHRHSNDELERELQRRKQIEDLINEGLENRYFFLMYQPQYRILDHSLRGYEALIRLRLPDGTMRSPGEFIPYAESTGLIVKIDNYVLEYAMTQFAQKQMTEDNKALISINISARTFSDPDFVKRVDDAIAKTHFNPECLELEITEYSLADDNIQAIENVSKLRERGISIALDDFGTGYTSLSQLVKVPFDLLKIDKTLIDGIETDEVKRDFAKAVIELGHLVNSEVIAEGVEKDEQITALKERGCDFVQGFLWGRPTEFEKL